MKLTFGSDPEFFLVDEAGKYKSAIEIVPGSKSKRFKIGKCSFYYDNVLAECNVPPADSRGQAIKNVGTTLSHFAEIIRPYGVRLLAQAAQRFPRTELQHKEALEAGCKTESCAYKLLQVDPHTISTKFKRETLRTAGGHIHLGTPLGQTHIPCVSLVRMLDLFVGIPALFIDHDTSSTLRRKLYGAAGRYRQPKHGVEYRSLGNFWLNSPDLVGLMFDLSSFAVNFVECDRHKELWEVDEETLESDDFWNGDNPDPSKYHFCRAYDANKLRNCFMTGNRREARPFLDMVFNYIPSSIANQIEKLLQPRPIDLYDEWQLN